MGAARRRKQRLGDRYGTPEGSNELRGDSALTIRRSELSGKWVVDLDLPTTRHRLGVWLDREKAELDLALARQIFGLYTVRQLSDHRIYPQAFRRYCDACKVADLYKDDDQVVAALTTRADGSLLVDQSPETLRAYNARFREHFLLSDAMWERVR